MRRVAYGINFTPEVERQSCSGDNAGEIGVNFSSSLLMRPADNSSSDGATIPIETIVQEKHTAGPPHELNTQLQCLRAGSFGLAAPLIQ